MPSPEALIALKGPNASLARLQRYTRLASRTLTRVFAGKFGRTETTLTIARALKVRVERLTTTIERHAAARRADEERSAHNAGDASSDRSAARARHLGPVTITPHT